MGKRKSIGKTIRFEVFKRDKFTCQYCGGKAPELNLEIDHINPVSKGGDNDIINLLTSCFDCNRGKRDIKLDDDAAISKQKNQLDELQERREQRELMYEWSEGLKNIDDEDTDRLVKHINEQMEPHSLNENGTKIIAKLLKKYDLVDLFKAIELSADKYLRYDDSGEFTKGSVEEFIKKIGGILHNFNQPIVQKKASYIKGICRNRFNYFDMKVGSIILNNYIKALKDHGYSDDQIADDLDTEVMPRTKKSKNWTEWKKFMERWTMDVYGFDDLLESVDMNTDIDGQDEAILDKELEKIKIDSMKNSLRHLLDERLSLLASLRSAGGRFKNFNEESIELDLYELVLRHIMRLKEFGDEIPMPYSFKDLPEWSRFNSHFSPIKGDIAKSLSVSIEHSISRYLSYCYGTSSDYLLYNYYELALTLDQRSMLEAREEVMVGIT